MKSRTKQSPTVEIVLSLGRKSDEESTKQRTIASMKKNDVVMKLKIKMDAIDWRRRPTKMAARPTNGVPLMGKTHQYEAKKAKKTNKQTNKSNWLLQPKPGKKKLGKTP